MCSHINEPRPRRTRLMLALSLAVLPLAGCACEDMDWLAIVAADAEAAVLHTAPDCRIGSLARLSKTSATLAGRADPALLDAARRDAERACYRARARQRFDTAEAQSN